MNFCPIPQGFRRFLFEPESKSPGVSPGSTPGKANDKCIIVNIIAMRLCVL